MGPYLVQARVSVDRGARCFSLDSSDSDDSSSDDESDSDESDSDDDSDSESS